MFLYLAVLTFAQAAAFQGWTSLYTNFAVEAAHFTGAENGIVQSVREIPGLLAIGVIFCLLYMREVTLTSLSIAVCGLGVVCTGWFPDLGGQIFWTLVLSLGFHFFEATNQSLILQYFSVTEAPIIIGRLRALTAAASLLMGGIILLFARVLPYQALFGIAGAVALIAGSWGFFQRPEVADLPPQRKGMVLRKRYWLYYALTFLSGARRQIFMVFSVFLLVERFGFSLVDMSLLFLFNNLVNWTLNPYIGRIINTVGERRILTVKYIIIAGLMLAYAYCAHPWVAGGLYILDQVLFNFTVSIRTFFQKIAEKSDVAPSMAMGVAVNHIAAVVVPLIGGWLWMLNYRIPFLLGVGFAAASLVMARCIPNFTQRKGT